MAVPGHGPDLDPALDQDEHMGGGLSLNAHHGAGREHGGPAESRQDGLLLVREQSPEAQGRCRPVQFHITVGELRCRPAGYGRHWVYPEPSGDGWQTARGTTAFPARQAHWGTLLYAP